MDWRPANGLQDWRLVAGRLADDWLSQRNRKLLQYNKYCSSGSLACCSIGKGECWSSETRDNCSSVKGAAADHKQVSPWLHLETRRRCRTDH